MVQYNIATIRALLRDAFTAQDLKRFLQDRPALQSILDDLGPGFSFNTMIDAVVDHCRIQALFPQLLSEIQKHNPKQYERHKDQLLASGALAPPAAHSPFTVPFTRNKRFVGRATELKELHRLLQAGQSAIDITPAGISGMGGIGKTQLAVEYAHQYHDAYPGGVFWVNAARDWSRQLVDLADQFLLAPADPSSPDRTGQMIAALAHHLKERPTSLFIFDNVADPDHLCTEQVGAGLTADRLGGRLLFTTRRRDMPPGLMSLDIQILPSGVAQQMILDARPQAAGKPELQKLCEALGRLPLALELAAAVLRKRPKLSLPDYLKHLQTLGAGVVAKKARVPASDLATYYATSLTPALQAQWDELQEENSRLLLRAAAELGEADLIPVVWLGMLAGLQDDETGLEEPLSDALHELEMISLVERAFDDRIQLHPLVREFATRRVSNGERQSFRLELATNVENTLPKAPHPSAWAITAGECLLDLAWSGEPAKKVRHAVLDALRKLMCDDDRPESERRTAASLLTRLRWLDSVQDISREEMLTYLELFARYRGFSGDRLSLVTTISHVLDIGTTDPRQEAQLLIYRAGMQGQLGESLTKDKLLEAAAEDYETARRILKKLIESEESQPEDHRIAARVNLGAGNLAVIQAETLVGAKDRDRRQELLYRAIASYLTASQSALTFGQDIVLRVSILQELGYTYALTQSWAEAEESCHRALSILEENEARVKDPRVYASVLAVILERTGHVHWLKAQSLALPEYEAAYNLAKQEIPMRERAFGQSEGLFNAHFNAGECLLAMHDCPDCSEPQPLEKACEHWRIARDIARHLGNKKLERQVDKRLQCHCQSDERQSGERSPQEQSP